MIIQTSYGISVLQSRYPELHSSRVLTRRHFDFAPLYQQYIFLILQKHKWNRTATISALTANALWRIHTIPNLPTPLELPLFRFIDSQDRFERPILVIRARHIAGMSSNDLQNSIITLFELARLHVAHLYSESQDVLGSSAQVQRVLQFVVIADLEGLGIRSVVSLGSLRDEFLCPKRRLRYVRLVR